MGRRIISIIGAAVLLGGLLLAISACENPLLGTVKQIYTTFHSKLIQANFSSNNAKQFFDPGIGNITVNFTDQSIGEVTSFDWEFGDGGSDTLPNPSHTYYSEGYFTVSLTVTGPYGTSTEIKENFVAAYGGTPLVDIYEPNNNDWVTGTVAVQATADFPPDPILNVQFFVDGLLEHTDTTDPYSYSWDTSLESENTLISLKARANTAGPWEEDDDTSVRVDNTPPTVTLTAPTGGNVSGDVALTATLGDSPGSGENRVEFFVDGSRRSTYSAIPYAYNWNARYETEGSSHTLLARGFDNVGLSADDSTSVTIDNLGDYSPFKLDGVRIDGVNNKISVDASPVDDVVVMAYEDSAGIIWLRVSTDSGASFDDPIKVIGDDTYKPTNPAVAYEPENRDLYLAYLHDPEGSGKKDIFLLRSGNLGSSWEQVFRVDKGPDPTSLALDVRGTYIGLLFDVGGRALYLAYSPDLGAHYDWALLVDYAFARDLSLTTYGGKAYLSYVNKGDELMFTTADLESWKVSELQKLATSVRGYSSVALSPDGNMVGLAFADRYANPMVLLAETGELKFDPVERIADSRDCAYTTLTLGIESIRLAYFSQKYGLRLAASQMGKYWINYTVEETGPFAYVSMAADGGGRVHIGYYNVDTRQERFATVPFNW